MVALKVSRARSPSYAKRIKNCSPDLSLSVRIDSSRRDTWLVSVVVVIVIITSDASHHQSWARIASQ